MLATRHETRSTLIASLVAPWLFLSAPAVAQTFSVPTSPNTGGSTADFGVACDPPRIFRRSVTFTPGTCSLESVYKMLLAVDVRAAGNDHSESVTLNHRVAFTVAGTGNWRVRVKHERYGHLRTQEDFGNCSRSTMSRIAYNVTGPVTFDPLGTSTDYDTGLRCTDSQTDVAESREGWIHGSGTASITLDFTWTASATSDASFAIGGNEAVVALGTAANVDCGFSNDKIDAASYSPPGNYGHKVTLTYEPSNITVVLDGEGQTCTPLGQTQPCTYTISGVVQGCIQRNYTVAATFYDSNDQPVCSGSTTTTNGSPNWSVQSTCSGPCRAEYVLVTATNDPGVVIDPDVRALAQRDERVAAVLRAPIATLDACFTPLPAAGPLGRIVAATALAGAGWAFLRRRRIATDD